MGSAKPVAVVLVSGGLDSATTLAIAQQQGFDCRAITFDYGQRHRVELEAATAVAKAMQVTQHVFMKIDLRAFGGSALTADIDVPKAQSANAHAMGVGDNTPSRIPATYVPARNTIFLSLALAFAETLEARDIFIGVNAVDYSGYPDCRPEFIEAFTTVANLATRLGVEGGVEGGVVEGIERGGRGEKGGRIRIHTPLIDLTKAQIIQRGRELGVNYALTTSCYDPNAVTGQPCGECESCVLRAAGFRTAGLDDPLSKRFAV